MFDQVEFGEKLKNQRKSKNLTQEEVAEKIGVSGQAVSKWEKGECLPDVYNLKMLGKLFQVSVDSLLEDEIKPEKIIETINIDGIIFEVVERPESIFAGKFVHAKSLNDNFDLTPSLNQIQKKYALDNVIGCVNPERNIVVSINYWLVGNKLHGMGFVKETTTECQPDGVDVFKMPLSLFVKVYIDNNAAKLLAKDECEPWEFFSYIRSHVMPGRGYKMAENGAQELEILDNDKHKSGYIYVPVERI